MHTRKYNQGMISMLIIVLILIIISIGVFTHFSYGKSKLEARVLQVEKKNLITNETVIPSTYAEAKVVLDQLTLQAKKGEYFGYDHFLKNIAILKGNAEIGKDLALLIATTSVTVRATAVALDVRVFKGVHLPADFLQKEKFPFVLSAYLVSELLSGSREKWVSASKILAERFPPEMAIAAYVLERDQYFGPGKKDAIRPTDMMGKMFLDSRLSSFFMQSIAFNSSAHKTAFYETANSFSKSKTRAQNLISTQINNAMSASFLMYDLPELSKERGNFRKKLETYGEYQTRDTAAFLKIWTK